MTSNIIYHYLYRITNIVEQKHYYGVRTSKNILPHQDLGVNYFSSSYDKKFILDQKEHPENYRYKIVSIANSKRDVIELEIKLHNKFNVNINPKFYNLAKQTSSRFVFDNSGKVSVKDFDGNTLRVSTDDPRIALGELVSVNKGMVSMKDSNGKIHHVATSDPRIVSGELASIIKKGFASMKDSSGNILRVSVDDPRIVSGELFGVAKGLTTMKDSDGNILCVSTNDPRIASGELLHINKDKVIMKDSNDNTFRVSTDDPRIASGELVSLMKGKLIMKDSNGNFIWITMDDSRISSGEVVGVNKGLFPAKDRMGCIKLISKNSQEWKTGEFSGIRKKYIYITPFGNFINDYTKIPYVKVKEMCVKYNTCPITKTIFNRYKLHLDSLFRFDEIEGKTFKELGFGIENWSN